MRWQSWRYWAILAVLIAGALLESATTTELRLIGNVESERAKRVLEDRLGSQPISEIVVIQSDSLTVDDEAFKEITEDILLRW